MSDTHITGGLTPSEWVNWRHPMNEGAYESLYHQKGGADGDHAVMAFANFALPDDDPRKITRAMVDDVKLAGTAAAYIASHLPLSSTKWEEAHALSRRCKVIAATLAALLPLE
jgi:hypothetical protein